MTYGQKSKLLHSMVLGGLCLASFGAAPIMAQNRQQWQSLKMSTRGAISHPREPAPTNSFYPIIRESAPDLLQSNTSANQGPGWANFGNGSRIKIPEKQSKNENKNENRLSPDVLETIRQLKEQSPEPRYQLSAQGPITGATPNPLQSPAGTGATSATATIQKEKQALESYLKLPRDKNIKITSLDFRNTNISDALRSLSELISVNLMLSQGITGQVTILFSDVTIEEAFNTLLSAYDLSFSWEGTILRIFPKANAPTITKIFPIQHTNAVEIKTIVDRMISPAPRGSCEVDARTNSLMITDTSAKLAEISELLPKVDVKESAVDVSSRPTTEVYYLNYADATALSEPIKMISSAVQIKEFSSSQASQAGAAGGAASTGRKDMMIITDTQNNLNRIRELIEKLDIAPIQVTIDAHIYEINKDEEERLGVNWQKSIPVAGGADNIFDMTIAPEAADAGGTGVFRFGSLDVNQFKALLAMLKTHSFAKVLSNPVITTLNNRAANITVGQAIPYISGSGISPDGVVSNTIGQANANITLDVTPSVTGNDEVFLDINPTISSVLGYSELGGNSTPNISNRSAKTQVICKNNHTIVIGGMIKTDKSVTVSKVPFLGDLPGIGKLFQKKTTREVRTELIIFITPHIVRQDSNRMASQTGDSSGYAAPRLTLQP